MGWWGPRPFSRDTLCLIGVARTGPYAGRPVTVPVGEQPDLVLEHRDRFGAGEVGPAEALLERIDAGGVEHGEEGVDDVGGAGSYNFV